MLNLYVSKRRDLRNRKGTTVCKFASTKSEIVPVLTDGKLEADYCYHLEFNRDVIKYECQPLGYYYIPDIDDLTLLKKEPHYTPDFQVWYKDKSIRYFEVKEEKFIDPELALLFPIWQSQAITLKKNLDFALDSEIRAEPYFSNLKTLFKAKKNRNINEAVLKTITVLLKKHKTISAYDLINKHNVIASIGDFYCLLANYKIKTDIKNFELSWNMSLELEA